MKLRNHIIINILISLISISTLYAQSEIKGQLTIDTIPRNYIKELQNDIQSLISHPDFSNTSIGISIYSLETGEFLYNYNENKNFIPASLNKLITTSAAIEYLGEDFTYNTKLFLDGVTQTNGEFYGNIIIRGTGDPSMNKHFHEDPIEILDRWVEIIDSLGIKAIRGNIIADDNYFDERYFATGWAWDDYIYDYSAQVNALSINDNKIDISIFPNENIGEAALFVQNPENSYIRIINNVTTIDTTGFNEIYARREQFSNTVELYGTIIYDSLKTVKHEVSVTIDNPTLFFLNLFKTSLEKKNIRFRGALLDIDELQYQRINYSELTPIAEYESPKLISLISVINKHSTNLGAEMLFKTIAKETTGIGSFEKGSEQINKFLSSIGINPSGQKFIDGSGLSRLNLNSPSNFTKLLAYIWRTEYFDSFLETLAKPGEDGSLSRRMRRSRAENNVYGKTGSMNGVSNICGYLKTRDDEMLSYVIMLQNFTIPQSVSRNLQDLICMRLASFSRKGI